MSGTKILPLDIYSRNKTEDEYYMTYSNENLRLYRHNNKTGFTDALCDFDLVDLKRQLDKLWVEYEKED